MSISLAIVFPLVMVFLLGTIQACLWWYAKEAALHAARQGVESGRSSRADTAARTAGDRAREVAGDLGGGLLKELQVDAGTYDGGERLRVEVKGESMSIVPGLPGITITQRANGPIERWTTPER